MCLDALKMLRPTLKTAMDAMDAAATASGIGGGGGGSGGEEKDLGVAIEEDAECVWNNAELFHENSWQADDSDSDSDLDEDKDEDAIDEGAQQHRAVHLPDGRIVVLPAHVWNALFEDNEEEATDDDDDVVVESLIDEEQQAQASGGASAASGAFVHLIDDYNGDDAGDVIGGMTET